MEEQPLLGQRQHDRQDIRNAIGQHELQIAIASFGQLFDDSGRCRRTHSHTVLGACLEISALSWGVARDQNVP